MRKVCANVINIGPLQRLRKHANQLVVEAHKVEK